MKLRELKIEDKGFDVRALQHCLNVHLDIKLKVDGYFGLKTQTAIYHYNGIKNIPNLNVCSLSTWYELLQDIGCEMYISDVLRLLPVI